VYAGIDPLTRQEIRLRSTVKDELQAQIALGRLLKEASEGRTPEANATMARLMDQYAAIAEWGVSTRQTNEGFIRRTIKVRRFVREKPSGSCRRSRPSGAASTSARSPNWPARWTSTTAGCPASPAASSSSRPTAQPADAWQQTQPTNG
jgi:hypothetical protein